VPDEQMTADDKAPYLSLTTLNNFFDKWGDGPIPPRIDKSALDNYSGGTQALLLSTLRLMGFVDNEGEVLPALREAVNDPAARKAHLTEWARRFYAPQIELAERNGTPQMLRGGRLRASVSRATGRDNDREGRHTGHHHHHR